MPNPGESPPTWSALQPGLDTYIGDDRGLRRKALGPLLAWAHAVVPKRRRSAVPVFLLATAGVRRLPAHKQDQLMAGVREILAGSGFRCVPHAATTSTD